MKKYFVVLKVWKNTYYTKKVHETFDGQKTINCKVVLQYDLIFLKVYFILYINY